MSGNFYGERRSTQVASMVSILNVLFLKLVLGKCVVVILYFTTFVKLIK